MTIRYEDIKNNEEINLYIQRADEALKIMGFTEHSQAHVTKCAEYAYMILDQLGYDKRTCELAQISGYIHDIGNVVNRSDHSQSGAVMAFHLLDKIGMCFKEIATIVSAIGNHDEKTGIPVNEVAAALILADKADVRYSRVRNKDHQLFDIHDRVNFAVKESDLVLCKDDRTISLHLTIDTNICSVADYFEIFLDRMMLSRRAGEYFGLRFKLIVNEQQLL